MNKSLYTFQKRSLLTLSLLMFITLGFYFFYWLYKTKEEINALGGEIPTFWFAVLPFANIYFDYRYAQDFIKYVRRQEDIIFLIMLTTFLVCLPFIAALIIQYELNRYEDSGIIRG